MTLTKKVYFALSFITITQTGLASPFIFEARSLGMGNTGVATADLATAPFANPAMLAFQRRNDDFSLLIAGGGLISDNAGVLDKVDDFQAARDRYAAGAGDPAAGDDMLAIAIALEDKVIAPELSAAIAVGFASDTYSMALSARTDIFIAGSIINVSDSVSNVNDSDRNILNIGGASTVEVGLSIARNFDLMGQKMSVGVTPKIVSVEAIEFYESISQANTDLSELTGDSVRSLGEFTTLDMGIVIELTENIQFGLSGSNLMTDGISYLSSKSNQIVTLKFDKQVRAGIAYRNEYFIIGADLDLIEKKSVFSSATSSGIKTQMLSLGVEMNALDFLQLRFGVMKNLAGDLTDVDKSAVYTAGLGIWLGFNVDIAAMIGDGETLGAFIQTGFRF